MRARNKTIGALGASLGLVIALTAVAAPASARPQPAPSPTTSSLSCGSLEGVTVTAPAVSISGLVLRSDETITVKVSPASAGDYIFLAGSTVGLTIFFNEGPAVQPYTLTGAGTKYYLDWSYSLADGTTSTLNRAWTFDCSSTSTPASSAPSTTTPTTPTTAAPSHGKGGRGK